jgi:hypothetical protein
MLKHVRWEGEGGTEYGSEQEQVRKSCKRGNNEPCGFHKMWWISWFEEKLSASERLLHEVRSSVRKILIMCDFILTPPCTWDIRPSMVNCQWRFGTTSYHVPYSTVKQSKKVDRQSLSLYAADFHSGEGLWHPPPPQTQRQRTTVPQYGTYAWLQPARPSYLSDALSPIMKQCRWKNKACNAFPLEVKRERIAAT